MCACVVETAIKVGEFGLFLKCKFRVVVVVVTWISVLVVYGRSEG